MSAPRIALLKASTHLQGGLEKQTLAIIRALTLRGCKIDLLCQAPCEWPGSDQVQIHTLSNRSSVSFVNLRRYDNAVRRWLEKHRYSRVLGLERHSLQTHYRAGSGVHRYFLDERKKLASFLKRASLALNPFHRLVLKLEAASFGPGGARRIYTNSHLVARQIQSYYATEDKRLCVIHNGIAWSSLAEAFEKSLDRSFQALFPLLDGKRCLLFLGHGYERKGLERALRALARAHSNFHLLVAGKERSLERFQQQARKLGLGSRVHWLGTKHTPLELYSHCEALVLPTLYDPFANVTLEALAMGLKTLTSSHDGASEILQEHAGRVLEPHDEQAWIEAIEALWKHPTSANERRAIRQSVQHLEASNQVGLLVDDLLNS